MDKRALAVGASEHDNTICDKAASAYCVRKFSRPAVLTSAAFFSSAGTTSSRSPDSLGPSFSSSSCSSAHRWCDPAVSTAQLPSSSML